MELNIALVMGFAVWCVISFALNLYLWFTGKEDADLYKDTIETCNDVVDRQRERADEYERRFVALVHHLDAIVQIGKYDDEV